MIGYGTKTNIRIGNSICFIVRSTETVSDDHRLNYKKHKVLFAKKHVMTAKTVPNFRLNLKSILKLNLNAPIVISIKFLLIISRHENLSNDHQR